MTGGHAANYHSGSRSLTGIPRNNSHCGSGRRTLGPTVSVLLLRHVSPLVRCRIFLLCLRAAFAVTIGAPTLFITGDCH
jgi:hypothetical protein